jgi:Tfp pilus assembly protein PilX
MVTHSRRGSALLLTMIILMVVFSLGSALLSLTTGGLMRSRNDMLRAQALDVAEAGVEKAIYYLRNTAPDGTVDGTWRTNGRTETHSTAGGDTVGTYTFSATNGTGADTDKIVILCTGTATLGSKSTSRRLRVVITRTEENISPWNNTIFGGVGQAGRSINGNVVMRGNVHLLGDGEPYTDVDGDGHWDNTESYTDNNPANGQYDMGENFTDTDGDGRRDAQEPFTDVNGNGSCDPPLTVTDLASEVGGTANIGNNYDGMDSQVRGLVPSCPTQYFNGETVESLGAKLRVKHGRVDVNGTASVGTTNATGNGLKETMNGAYVNDGYGGNQGASQVYSDNGTSKKYDLKDFIQFPDLISPTTVDGVDYSSHMAYLSDTGLHVTGPLNLQVGQTYTATDLYGNSITVSAAGTITISGIVYVDGDINLNRGATGGDQTFRYSGRGTLVSTGNINVHTNVLPVTGFPATDALGMIARHEMTLATGGGDSQLKMVGAFYAQEQVTSMKQNEIAGTFVASYFSMTNVPHMYQVPTLHQNLPPGMPGSTSIWVVFTQVNSWKEVAPA